MEVKLEKLSIAHDKTTKNKKRFAEEMKLEKPGKDMRGEFHKKSMEETA